MIRAKDYDEALAIANDTEFGLAAGICTTSLKYASHFKRNSEAGMVMVNLPTAGVDYHVPFGGRKGSSYGAREQGAYAREVLYHREDGLYLSRLSRDEAATRRESVVTKHATAPAYEPRYIRLDANDNVAIVVNDFGLPAKTRFPCGLELRNFVPQGHKVALADIAEGAPIRRYNEVIGTAAKPILAGEWVDEARIRMPTPPELDKLELATAVPAPQPPLEGYTFEGFRNPDGSVGTKNVLAITHQRAMRRRHAGVCDQAHQGGAAAEISQCRRRRRADAHLWLRRRDQRAAGDACRSAPCRTSRCNPNFGGEVMVVGLGCEKLVPERLLPDGRRRQRSCACRTRPSTASAPSSTPSWRWPTRGSPCSTGAAAKPVPASDLVVGLQCGGSDAFSGVTANPALGFAADLLVRAGATVMFSEVTEVRDAIHLLTRARRQRGCRPRADPRDGLVRRLSRQGDADRSANTTPGNKKGGLANIVEKSLGSIVKSGTSADRRRAVAGRAGAPEGHDLRRDAGQRLHLRHLAARLRHDAAGVHHRPRHALRARRRAGHQGVDAQRAGAPLE